MDVMRRTIPVLLLLASSLSTAYAGSPAAGLPPGILLMDPHNHEWTPGVVSGKAGSSHFYVVGSLHICHGYGWMHTKGGTIDWGDGSSLESTIPPPQTSHQVLGQHLYAKPGVYPIHWRVGAVCVSGPNQTGYDHQWEDWTPWSEDAPATTTAYIYDALPDVAKVSCPAVTTGATARCSVTITSPAPPGGEQITAISDNAAVFTVPRFTATIPGGNSTGKIAIRGTSRGTATIAVSAGLDSATVTSAVNVN